MKEKKEFKMKLQPPKQITFWVSIILVVIGVILFAADKGPVVPLVLVLAGFVLLAMGNLLKGL
jgi:hypothetical protein